MNGAYLVMSLKFKIQKYFSQFMYVYTYECQDIIQIALKKLPGGWSYECNSLEKVLRKYLLRLCVKYKL
jgi:hypothetical protein